MAGKALKSKKPYFRCGPSVYFMFILCCLCVLKKAHINDFAFYSVSQSRDTS